ncbi:MAG: hypothetical protein JNJ83_24545 [Verrucomicrobiaceae bacterium]|nr:hypothetical protein [Verrucomicrobiaceae bacterium]
MTHFRTAATSALFLATTTLCFPQQPAGDAPPGIIAPGDAKAKPLQPESTAPAPQKGPKQAIIDAESNFFDPATNVTVFEGNVKARHPDFQIDCERLELFMKKQDKKSGPGPSAPPTGVPGDTKKPDETAKPVPAPEAKEEEGGIEKAVATGTRVVVIQHTPEGDKMGTGRKVTYDGNTGDMVFSGMPTIQEGARKIVGTDPSTVLTITGTGKVLTKGPNQVHYDVEQPGSKGKKSSSPAPATVGPGQVAPKPKSNPVPVSTATKKGSR